MGESLPRPGPAPPRAAAAPTKLRVLCLHGFRTNKEVMLAQTRGIRAALGDSASFVFLNGTFEARGPTDPMIEHAFADSAPFYEWWENQLADRSPIEFNDAESSVKARRKAGVDQSDAWGLYYHGIERTMEYIDEEIRRLGPFDVVIGFSQGASLLTLLTMWYLRHGGQQRWKIAVCVGGVATRGINVRPLFMDASGRELSVPLPSIHIIGKEDPLYLESHRLVELWAETATSGGFKRWVFEHDDGHKFPSVSRNPEFYAKLARTITQHCREGAGVSSKL